MILRLILVGVAIAAALTVAFSPSDPTDD
ncbi:hypothetical protein SEA_CLAYDA5_49 [Microbacterium phage Clayda5]|nr:hypothetical protein SEA_CLAYDA5_49 [Microbacterium phage Clayda5]